MQKWRLVSYRIRFAHGHNQCFHNVLEHFVSAIFFLASCLTSMAQHTNECHRYAPYDSSGAKFTCRFNYWLHLRTTLTNGDLGLPFVSIRLLFAYHILSLVAASWNLERK